ncbi:MAG: ABC transporter permease [Paracoccaceae bacterium]|nr:ABC transporter permease [Paracoccaceae bacterium]
MSPLDTKLFRDLRRMKAQAGAIAMVIAMGVLLQVMMSGSTNSLTETRRAYYERNHLADIFVTLTRAPESELQRLGAIPGVRQVEGRVIGGIRIDLPQETVPIQGQAISLAETDRPGLNQVHLTNGTLPAIGSDDEALLLEGFARARGLNPGDRLQITANGVRKTLRVTGLAQSPELLFVAAPGELAPDAARFGVVWMRQDALSAIYGMQGAFNDAVFAQTRDANTSEIIDAIDSILDRWGGTGAFAREDLISDRFVMEEINSLIIMSRSVPPLFLAVAAFLLYIVISRMVQSEREEIGLLKAFGYTSFEVSAHYMKAVLIIAVAGVIAGCLLGVAAGRWMVGVYTQFYNFPFLVFRPDTFSFIFSAFAALTAASTGGLFVLRRVFALTPAEAMRPPTPPDFSKTLTFKSAVARMLDQPSRMVLRGIARRPLRTAALSMGIAGGMALSAGMTTIYASFEDNIDLFFSVVDRSDATVIFTHPVGDSAATDIARVPGIFAVEPAREVAAVFRNGLRSHRGGITGLPHSPEITRAIDASVRPIPLPDSGIVLSVPLANKLALAPGETLTVDVREGRRPTLQLPVVAVAESLLGAPAYMSLPALNRALKEPGRMTVAHVMFDSAEKDTIVSTLKAKPAVAGFLVAEDAQASLEKLMNEGAGAARYIMGVIAFVITFGVIYNAARISHAERLRDLASLRVMGFTRPEAAFVLLGELALITLVAIPVGSAAGYLISLALAAGFSSDLYQITATYDLASHGFAASFVVGASIVSGWLVKRDLDRADLVIALKTRE